MPPKASGGLRSWFRPGEEQKFGWSSSIYIFTVLGLILPPLINLHMKHWLAFFKLRLTSSRIINLPEFRREAGGKKKLDLIKFFASNNEP